MAVPVSTPVQHHKKRKIMKRGYSTTFSPSPVDEVELVQSVRDLHLQETPKSSRNRTACTTTTPRQQTCRKRLFVPPCKQALPNWTDKEVSCLIQFLMLYTDGKVWVSHKNELLGSSWEIYTTSSQYIVLSHRCCLFCCEIILLFLLLI